MTVQIDSALISDAELLTRVRGGDTDAYGELYRRHADAAKRLAVVLARDRGEAEDLAADAFARVLGTLRAGGGPRTAFRPYLLTSVRNAFYDRVRRNQKVEPTDVIEEYERPEPYEDPSIAALERSYAARAFARLPERWRAVLWHTEVEGETPTQIAPLFGLTANAVAVLAFRARERLRQGYLAEHITLTGSPRCHWTGEHLPGYVRAGLAGRERTKVEDHLAECAECRRLHRELTEANVSLRVVLAPLLLGAAGPGYLVSTAAKTGLAGLWASLTAAIVAWWHGLTGGLVRLAGDVWWWLTTLPKRLARRYGGPNVAAAGGLILAAVLGVAVFVVSVVAHPGLPQSSRGSTAAKLPVPAPAEPPLLTSDPQPPLLTSAPPLPTLSPLTPTSPTPKAHASPAGAPEGVSITPDPAGSSYVAGGRTRLPLVFSRTESGGRLESLTLADRSARRTPKKSWSFQLALPTGVTLAGRAAGDGWTCRGASAVTCTRAEPGARTVAKVPIAIGPEVTGFQSVGLRFAGRSMRLRLPIAPTGTVTAFAGTGRLRTALGGSALLSCLPRPACLTSDNNALTMVPLLPTETEPGPPSGLFAPGGPTTPEGQLAELAGEKVASGAQVEIPRGARVRWAGLVVGGPKAVPGLVALHGPGSGWHPVKLVRSAGQAYADVTRLLQSDGGGAWWVAAAAAALPGGPGAYAGWSIAVVYEQATAPLAEVAVQLGPTELNRPDSRLTVRVLDGAKVEVGLALWEGDRGLTGDSLLIGRRAVGDAGNLARGESVSASAVACAKGGSCGWRTPGVDVLRFEGRADGGTITLRSGKDPLVLGLLAYAQQIDSR